MRRIVLCPSHARRWQASFASARFEVAPGLGHDLLAPLWPRVLSFVAPTR